jgi:molecular chaperone IbpA
MVCPIWEDQIVVALKEDDPMRTFDLAPLYRATVGFDQIADLMDRVLSTDAGTQTYPPYNIEKTADDAYRITIAVAGFGEDDLSVEVKENSLIVSARKSEQSDERTFLHRGIATRAFQRSFRLADHIKVSGAKLENGLLHVELVREIPETLKPRTIAIETGPAARGAKVIENQAA